MKAPKAPDPAATAAAQSQSNKETAIAQYGLNATNQKTPYGSLTYNQIGKWDDGTPRYEATQTLSPEQQKLYGLETQLSSNLGELGVSQSSRLGQLLGTPVDLSNESAESRLMELGRKRLDPTLDRRRASTEQDLYNRGVRPGTEAYSRAMEGVSQGENDAYNSLLLSGRQQAIDEMLKQRNQGINEIMALASGTQVQQPGYVNTPTPGVNGTDVAGITNNAYQQKMAGYQSKLNGLLGLGTAVGGWAFSDRRLKSNIDRIGTHSLGFGVYEYDMDGRRQRGVMADEVAQVMPAAVRSNGEYLQVNYGMIGGI